MKRSCLAIVALVIANVAWADEKTPLAYVEFQVTGADATGANAPLDRVRVDLEKGTWQAADGSGFDRHGEGPLSPALTRQLDDLVAKLVADPPHSGGIFGSVKRLLVPSSGPRYELTIVTATDPPRTVEVSGSLEKPGPDAALIQLLDYVHGRTSPDAYEIGLPGEKVRTGPPLEDLPFDLPGTGILRTAGSMIESVVTSATRRVKGTAGGALDLYRGALRTVEATAEAARGTAEAVQGTVKAVEGTARAVEGTAEAARGTASAVEKTVDVVRSGFGLRRRGGADGDPARTGGLAGLLQQRIDDGGAVDGADDR